MKGAEKIGLGALISEREGRRHEAEDSISVDVLVDHDIPGLKTWPMQAIVGLGPGDDDEFGNGLPKQLGLKRFSFCLGDGQLDDGVIVWNDLDRSKDPRVQELPVTAEIFWGTGLSDLKLITPGK